MSTPASYLKCSRWVPACSIYIHIKFTLVVFSNIWLALRTAQTGFFLPRNLFCINDASILYGSPDLLTKRTFMCTCYLLPSLKNCIFSIKTLLASFDNFYKCWQLSQKLRFFTWINTFQNYKHETIKIYQPSGTLGTRSPTAL